MNNGRRHTFRDERGGAHVLVIALLALGAITTITVVAFNVAIHYAAKNEFKPALDFATHAASLDLDRVQASYGRIAWDSARGTVSFYNSLYRNLHLDAAGHPLAGSMLSAPPVVHLLTYATAAAYPYDYTYTATVNAGTPQQTTRHIETRIYGPSIVAVVEIRKRPLGGAAAEPIVVTSVSSVRPRR